MKFIIYRETNKQKKRAAETVGEIIQRRSI